MRNLLFLLMLGFSISQCGSVQSPRVTAAGKDVSIAYGQPSKRDRVIFGQLVPYGQVWRTGANEATEITFTTDRSFGGHQVKAGTYTLFTVPGEAEWTIILNSELNQFGAFKYEEHKNKDVLSIKVPSRKIETVVEKFTIRFTDTSMVMEWDQTQVEISLG